MSEVAGGSLSSSVSEAERRFPTVEVFGPTLQGEGLLAGKVTHFIRLGGCDFGCLWCDSAHAVLPAEVRKAEKLTTAEIVERVKALPGKPDWVTISGGNPALHPLGNLVHVLHALNFDVAIETQGSMWKEWMVEVDVLTVSPKPPSSGMRNEQLPRFLESESLARARHAMAFEGLPGSVHGHREYQTILKVPVWDEADYQFARKLHLANKTYPFYLSVVTAMGGLYGDFDGGRIDTRDNILNRTRWLAERAAGDDAFGDVAGVFPQLHALIWPVTERGH